MDFGFGPWNISRPAGAEDESGSLAAGDCANADTARSPKRTHVVMPMARDAPLIGRDDIAPSNNCRVQACRISQSHGSALGSGDRSTLLQANDRGADVERADQAMGATP